MRCCHKWLSAMLLLMVVFSTAEAEARKARRRGKKKKPAVVSKDSAAAIKKLMGVFHWGQTDDKVLSIIEDQIRASYKPRIRKEQDPLLQDRIRKQMGEDLLKLKQGVVAFKGPQTPWDVSLVEKEFAHKNDESMLVRWAKDDRRFYFFHRGKLWKIYIAFNSELFRGKTFNDFQRVMERRFGRAEARWKLDLRGNSEMSHVEWPPVGRTSLLALDETAFYGNFCLVLIDRSGAATVRQARAMNAPKRKYSDPLVNAAIGKRGGGSADPNSDIVDKLTGKRKGAKSSTPTKRHVRPDEVAPAPTRKTPRRGKSGDPLGDLDI